MLQQIRSIDLQTARITLGLGGRPAFASIRAS